MTARSIATLSSAAFLCCATAALGANNTRVASQTRPALDLLATVRTLASCRAADDLYRLDASVAVEIRNRSEEVLVVPAISSDVGIIRLWKGNQTDAAAKREYQVELEIYRAGTSSMNRDDFMVLQPGARRLAPFVFSLKFFVAFNVLNEAWVRGIPRPGPHTVSFEWITWPAGRREADRWASEFRQVGRLWTMPLDVHGITINIPGTPEKQVCDEGPAGFPVAR